MDSKSDLNIVMYHYVRDLGHSRYPAIKGMDTSLFCDQIRYFSEHYQVVTMEQVMAAECEGENLPEKAMLLTFDDGYIDHYTYVLPVLEEYGMQGSFFIPGKVIDTHELLGVNRIHYVMASTEIGNLLTDVRDQMDYYRGQEYNIPPTEELWEKYAVANAWDDAETIFVKRMLQTALPEKLRDIITREMFAKYVGIPEEVLAYELYMTEDQIKAMKRHGMHIGIHGYDHYWLNNLSQEQMHADIDRGLEIMSGYIDAGCWSMNYPYGGYSDDVVSYVRERGACVGFTVERRSAEIGEDDALLLPRWDCNDFKEGLK